MTGAGPASEQAGPVGRRPDLDPDGVRGAAAFEAALVAADDQRYLLRLYVVGATAASQRAVTNLKTICDEQLPGRYTLEVVDVFEKPELAAGEQILAAPTLVRLLPEPIARLVGDMSDRERVLLGLDLRPLPPQAP